MRRAWRALGRLGTPGVVGVVLLTIIVVACLVGPLLSPYGINEPDLSARNQGPSWEHPFGTAALGEDMLTRVLVAGRVSLLIGLATALVATIAGAGLGISAGARGGWLDSALARLTDLVLIVPGFVILIVLSISFESVGPGEIILILALLSWPPLFRLTRASSLRTRELPYAQAARAAGAGWWRVAWRHLLPAATPEIASFAALAVGVAILTESALSFLSLGLDPDGRPSWGTLMIGAQDTIEDRPWLTIFPGLMVLLTVLAVSLIGDAVRAALEPRSAWTPLSRRWTR